MPHSSGGGSHGGGSHGGSFGGGHGSGSSGPRTSRHYFYGCRTFVYYRNGMPNYIYSDSDIKDPKYKKMRYLALLGLLPFFVILTIILVCELMPPTKITPANFDTQIIDNAGVLGDTTELMATLEDFKDKTGITPVIQTLNNDDWNKKYFSLEDYAYNTYLKKFAINSHECDERCWLIVYSVNPSMSDDWYWEGMQGNDTDNILTEYKADEFREMFHQYLVITDAGDVNATFNDSFKELNKNVMKVQVDPGFVAGMVLSFSFLGVFVLVILLSGRMTCKPEELSEVKNNKSDTPKTRNCEYCGGLYVVGAHLSCPHCGGQIPAEEENSSKDNS